MRPLTRKNYVLKANPRFVAHLRSIRIVYHRLSCIVDVYDGTDLLTPLHVIELRDFMDAYEMPDEYLKSIERMMINQWEGCQRHAEMMEGR